MIKHRAIFAAAALLTAVGCDFTPLHRHYRCVQSDWLHVDPAASPDAAPRGLLLNIRDDRTWRMAFFEGAAAPTAPDDFDSGTWSLSGRRLILRQSPPAELFAGYIYEIVSCENDALTLVIAGETVEFSVHRTRPDSPSARAEQPADPRRIETTHTTPAR